MEKPKFNVQRDGVDKIRMYKQHGTDWQEEKSKLCRGIQSTEHCSTAVIFASSQEVKNCEDLKIIERTCDKFWKVVQDDLNGSFHCEYTVDDEGELIGHVSWSCFKIKKARKPPGSSETHYSWLQVTVLVQFQMKTGQQVVFFINLPTDLEEQIQETFSTTHKDNPFIWHTTLTQQVKVLYDDAVWSMRDLVRSVEKARNANLSPVPNFPSLHDTARHVSHINEILEVAEHTVHRMIQEQVAWSAECATMPRKSRLSWVRNEQELRFFAKEMHSLKTRSQSLSERMQNEIHLVRRIQYHLDCVLILQQAFNLVSQRLGRNAQGDGAIMKTIAIVSLVYLPGTFVSGLFGTNFFDLSTSGGVEQSWTVSSHFWLYWAITIPLTLATVIVWAIWHALNRDNSPPRFFLV